MAQNDYRSPAAMDTATNTPSAGAASEQSREIAEVQGAMFLARQFPRDEERARDSILRACTRKSLAEAALYEYQRAGNKISGPSIRLAETCARLWGNLTYGFREIARYEGESEVLAYAWDLETNCRVTRQFTVRHMRDTQKGPVELTQERDIYEMIANFAQRRVRAAILEVVPGDIIEDAVGECQKALEESAQSKEGKDKYIQRFFKQFGVTKKMLEQFLGYSLNKITPEDYTRLQKIAIAIRDGEGQVEDYFGGSGKSGAKAESPASETEGTVDGFWEKMQRDFSPELLEQIEQFVSETAEYQNASNEDVMAYCDANWEQFKESFEQWRASKSDK